MDEGSDPLRVKQIDTMESLSLKDQSQLLPQWMIELKDELECPVCLETIMDPPIFLCEKGHGLCGSCREDIKNRGQPCPVCRGALTEVRNLMVEQMLDKLPKECDTETVTGESGAFR